MIKANFILFLLISNSSLFGQYFNRYGDADTTKILAINRYGYQVDTTEVRGDSTRFILDSIEVNVKNYHNKIETTSFFKGSKSILRISFYLKDCELVMARVKEQSPQFSDLNAFSIFYFENDSIFYSDYYFNVRMCMAIPVNKPFSEIYGYNPNLNGDNLKKYVRELFSKFKIATNMGLPQAGLDKLTSAFYRYQLSAMGLTVL